MNGLIVQPRCFTATATVATIATVGFVILSVSIFEQFDEGEESQVDEGEEAQGEVDEERFLEWVEQKHSRLFVEPEDALLSVEVTSDGVYVDGRQVETFIDSRDAYEEVEGSAPETWHEFTDIYGVRGEPLEKLTEAVEGVVEKDWGESTYESPPASVHIRSDGLVDTFWFDRVLVTLVEAGFTHATVDMPDWFVDAVDDADSDDGKVDSYLLHLFSGFGYEFCGELTEIYVPRREDFSSREYPTEHWLRARGLVDGDVDNGDLWREFDVSDSQSVKEALQIVWEKDALRSMQRTVEELEDGSVPLSDGHALRTGLDMPMWLIWGVAIKNQRVLEQEMAASGDPYEHFAFASFGDIHFTGRPGSTVVMVKFLRHRSVEEFLELAKDRLEGVRTDD